MEGSVLGSFKLCLSWVRAQSAFLRAQEVHIRGWEVIMSTGTLNAKWSCHGDAHAPKKLSLVLRNQQDGQSVALHHLKRVLGSTPGLEFCLPGVH